ncbi:MAG TPA: NADH-quinone oxidoreductase subunit M [Gemmataceae bacterium]|nr:NADH-quinone oxidoreductase subunit M [Gemmataceae bacterium]
MALEQLLELSLIALPLVGAIVVAALGPRRGEAVRAVSVGVAIVCLGCAGALAAGFMALDRRPAAFAPEFVASWELLPLGSGAVHFFIGVDGLNIWLVVLTAVLILPCVLVSWTHVTERVNEFYAWLLALQTCMFGVFLAFDIVLFYIFFELSLIPLFFLIGIWGGPERRHAARKFFVFTLAGSVLTLLGVMAVVIACHKTTGVLTFSIPQLVDIVQAQLTLQRPADVDYWRNIQYMVFALMMAGFAVKVPLVPLHTWLPLAHVEAPTAGSVDLAGVLLKIGAYGFLRLCIPLAPDASLLFGLPVVTCLAAIGIVYGALCAFSQNDVKRLVAYSSVSHLGLCMIGMFSLTAAGLAGSLMQMINHGLSTGALFLLIGVIYERYHTRKLSDYSGMAKRLPYFGFFLVFIALSSVGLPGLNGFVGEALCLMGIMEQEVDKAGHGPLLTVVAASGMILGAWYLMTMLRRLLFGQVKEPEHHGPPIMDLQPREWVMIAPLAVLCLLLGVYPKPVLDSARPDLETVAGMADRARARESKMATPPAGVHAAVSKQ